MKGHTSQRQDVLQWLIEHPATGITQKDAYSVFDAPITRLAAVIFDLRQAGHDIVSVDEESHNCYGTNNYVRYRLVQ
jgi:hypothetical protein